MEQTTPRDPRRSAAALFWSKQERTEVWVSTKTKTSALARTWNNGDDQAPDVDTDEEVWQPKLNVLSLSLLQCGHSNHERYGFIFTLFSLYLYFFFHLFCSDVLYFSRTNQSHLWTEAMAQTFFLLFSVFLSFHATRFTGRKNGFTRVTKLKQKCSKYHICTNLLKSAQEQRSILH